MIVFLILFPWSFESEALSGSPAQNVFVVMVTGCLSVFFLAFFRHSCNGMTVSCTCVKTSVAWLEASLPQPATWWKTNNKELNGRMRNSNDRSLSILGQYRSIVLAHHPIWSQTLLYYMANKSTEPILSIREIEFFKAVAPKNWNRRQGIVINV